MRLDLEIFFAISSQVRKRGVRVGRVGSGVVNQKSKKWDNFFPFDRRIHDKI
jgi:hypothetical protein